MASTPLQSLHQSILRHHNHHQHCFTSSPDSISFEPSKSYRLFSNVPCFSSPPSTTSSSTVAAATVSFSAPLEALANYLSTRDFRQADEETRRLLIALGGEAAQKRGYVFFSEVQFIEAADLQAIDRLWRQHSSGRFGYAVQRRLWEKSGRDFTRFFIRVGWMRRLDTEVEQYGYRSFPGEFMWELKYDTPEGHLPLTNALRGTQLLRSILTHPAFEEIIEEGGEKSEEEGGMAVEDKGMEQSKLPGGKRVFKPDHSF